MINSINWIDGLDGLSTGVALIASVTLGIISLTTQVSQPLIAVLCFALAGALLGFLRWNFHPAKIFTGTTGVQFVGYTLAVLSILGSAKVAVALLVLGVPIIDTFWIIVGRLSQRRSPFTPDRSHIHHRLLDLGLSHRDTVLVIYAICAGLGILALLVQEVTQAYAFISMFIVAGLLLFGPTRGAFDRPEELEAESYETAGRDGRTSASARRARPQTCGPDQRGSGSRAVARTQHVRCGRGLQQNGPVLASAARCPSIRRSSSSSRSRRCSWRPTVAQRTGAYADRKAGRYAWRGRAIGRGPLGPVLDVLDQSVAAYSLRSWLRLSTLTRAERRAEDERAAACEGGRDPRRPADGRPAPIAPKRIVVAGAPVHDAVTPAAAPDAAPPCRSSCSRPGWAWPWCSGSSSGSGRANVAASCRRPASRPAVRDPVARRRRPTGLRRASRRD